MKEYYIRFSKSFIVSSGSIRKQLDVIKIWLLVTKYLNMISLNELLCAPEDADMIIYVDKMSRMFLRQENKIHSMQYPFNIKEGEKNLETSFQEIKIDNQLIAIIFAILESNKKKSESIDNMLDCFMEAMEEFGIRDGHYAQDCWKILMYLGMFEPGYLRYDHDEKENQENKENHPIDHIDFYFSSNNTFKLGLKKPINYDELKRILDIKNSRCYFLS